MLTPLERFFRNAIEIKIEQDRKKKEAEEKLETEKKLMREKGMKWMLKQKLKLKI